MQWLDDGDSPLLNTIGATFVGLYNGNGVRCFGFGAFVYSLAHHQRLVQQIEPVNVQSVHSLTFTVCSFNQMRLPEISDNALQPDSAAGPDGRF